MEYSELFEEAIRAAEFSYSKYSSFRVGAALIADDGEIFTGCNIENASFSMTNCAERTAIFKAVSAGKTKFRAIAVAGSPDGDFYRTPCVPCGACLQVISEFCGDDFIIILSDGVYKFRDFLPMRFTEDKMNSNSGGNNA
ncbi:MAG: cytidine deaminase [Ruminococcus sp.]|nr:cytidine deaminase [Ruminococcus sp.]